MIRRNWIVINVINKILIVNYIDSSCFLQLEALHGERCMEFDILASELMWFFLSFLTKEFNCEVVLPWAGNIFARFPLPCTFPRNTREADPHFPHEKRSCRATSEEQKHDSCRAITAPWSLTNSLYSFSTHDCFFVSLITQTCLAYSFCSQRKLTFSYGFQIITGPRVIVEEFLCGI